MDMSGTAGPIVFFTQGHVFGGHDVICLHLIEHWDKRVHKIALRSRSQNVLERYIELAQGRNDITVEEVSYPDVLDVQRWLLRASVPKVIAKWLTKLVRPLIVAWDAIRFAQKFRNIRPVGVVSNSGGYPGGVMNVSAILGAWLAGVPRRIFVAHSFASRSPLAFRIYDNVLDRLVARAATDIVTVSRTCAQQIASSRALRRPIQVIQNGVPINTSNDYCRDTARSMLKCSQEDRVIGILGHVEEHKGQQVAIRAMPLVLQAEPHARLVIIGWESPDYGAEVRALSRQLGVEHAVRFAGFIPHADRLLMGIDVLLVPSVGWESFGLVVLEAMARRRPVIVSDIGGLPEVVEDEQTGLVCPSHDPEALANQMIRILTDPALGLRLSEAAFATLRTRFTVARMVREYETLLRAPPEAVIPV